LRRERYLRDLTYLQARGVRVEDRILIIPDTLSTLDVQAVERLCAGGEWDWVYEADRHEA
jgi:hypothetical protein